MAKITLTDVTAGYDATTTNSANNTLIEAAVENTLSRDGTVPNQMEANLDMNSARILNLPDAVANQEPLTLAQASTLASISTAFTQENVGAVLYPRTSAEVSAAVTPTNYYYPAGNVLRYGTNTTPGTTDMSTPIGNALSLLGSHDTYFPPGTYKTGQVDIDGVSDGHVLGYGATIRWANQASTVESMRIENTCSNITIEGLTFKGDDRADATYPQIGVHVRDEATTVLNGLRIINCRFENLTQAVGVIGSSNATVYDVLVSGCHITEMAGEVGGTGYGVHISLGNTLGNCRVVDNYIEKCHRHSIYIAAPRSGTVVANNTIYKHRNGDTDADKGAIVINRGANAVVKGNTIRESVDTAIRIDVDTNNTADTENIVVSDNVISHGDAVDIHIGGGAPATSGALRNVLITNNVIDRDDATNFENSIEMRTGIGVTISGNIFWATNNYASLYSLVRVIGQSETSGTATYTDDLTVSGNVFSGSGANFRPIRIDNLAADSGAKMVFANNIFNITGTGSRAFYIPQGSSTNGNMQVIGQSSEGLYNATDRTIGGLLPVFTAADTSPSIKGSNVWLSSSTGVTINDFDDGEKGQFLFVISDGATVYDTTSTNLNGSSADITTANNDVTMWINEDGSQWRLMGFVDASADNSAGA